MKRCWYVILAFFLFSCSPRALHEAQDVVSQADSLWQQGEMYRDSVSLAQAYSSLGNWKWFYADEYAHSCYHYGKLLRAQDDPVSAMQVFINATHAGSDDKQILGRIYNNMGDICHRANEFDLSYDMFKRSAEVFLSDKDTLSYYYCLNDMAFELAEQGKKEETLILVARIEENCADKDVIAKMWETKARLYQATSCYDSVIIYVDSIQASGCFDLYDYMLKARAFQHMEKTDSALYYAQKVVSLSPTDACAIAAYYILSHLDKNLSADSVIVLTSARSDAQKSWAYAQGKLSQATQLLEQDISRKPDWRWMIAIIGTLVVMGSIIGLYVNQKRKQHVLLSQKIAHLEISYSDIRTNKTNRIEQTCAILRASASLKSDLSWKDYDKMCVFVNEQFNLLASKLKQTAVLNETEIRLCVLVLIGLSRLEIANTLPYSLNSVGKLKDHTAKLLGTTGKNLHDFLFRMAVES